jgi:HEPN domain-containing protein
LKFRSGEFSDQEFDDVVLAERLQELLRTKLAVSHIDLFVAKAVESSLREKTLLPARFCDLSELFSIAPITSAVRVASGDSRHIS